MRRLIVILIACCSSASVAVADFAVSFSLPQSQAGGNSVNGVDGFDFIPTTNLTVTALGWFDYGGDGLLHTHPVGIYNTTLGTLLASAVIDNTSALTATDFRYSSIAPLTLLAGTSYSLIGYGEGPNFDPYVVNPAGGYIFGQNLTYEGFRTARSTGLILPTGTPDPTLVQGLYVGANFQYTFAPAASVPEPASAALLAVGGIGLALMVRRRR